MAETPEHIRTAHENSLLRKLLDSPFIMLVLSLLIVFLSYTIWGVIELFSIPPGVLP